MKRTRLLVMFLIGIVLFVPAILGANWMGQRWTNSPDAQTPWWLNPSFSVSAKTAYNYFAVGLLILGGVLAGGAATAILKNRRRPALLLMFGAIISAGGGFNPFYWVAP